MGTILAALFATVMTGIYPLGTEPVTASAPEPTNVTFKLTGWSTTVRVTPKRVLINGADTEFNYDPFECLIDAYVPSSGSFNMQVETDYGNTTSGTYTAETLNNAEITATQKTVVDVEFGLFDSKSSATFVTPTHIYTNGVEVLDFTYDSSNSHVKMRAGTGGSFTLKVTADNYVDYTSEYTAYTLNNTPVNMVKTQVTGQMTCALSWTRPSGSQVDLDTWVGIAKSDLQVIATISYNNMTFQDENTKVTLDKDDLGDQQGETTEINPVHAPYIYQVWINRYSGEAKGKMTELDSRVVVTYRNATQTINVPKDAGEHPWWHVYDVINGEIQVVNTLQDQQPGS